MNKKYTKARLQTQTTEITHIKDGRKFLTIDKEKDSVIDTYKPREGGTVILYDNHNAIFVTDNIIVEYEDDI